MYYLIVSIFCILQSSLCLGSEGVVEAAPRKINLNAQLILDPQLQANAGRQLIASFQKGSQKETVQFIINPADKSTDPSINKRPVGLENVGNSCYLNSALQLFNTMNSEFRLVFDQSEVGINPDSLLGRFNVLLNNLHIKGYEEDTGPIENPQQYENLVHDEINRPKNLFSAISSIVSPIFGSNSKHKPVVILSASEPLMTHLKSKNCIEEMLEPIIEEIFNQARACVATQIEDELIPDSAAAKILAMEKKEILRRKISALNPHARLQQDPNEFISEFLFTSIFKQYKSLETSFSIRSQDQLIHEGKNLNDEPKEVVNNSFDVALSKKPSKATSLEGLLKKAINKTEDISDYKIGGEIKPIKKVEQLIHTGPFSMVILKRNVTDDSSIISRRLENPTPFPLVGLNLGNYCESENPDAAQYELLGVIMHSGSGTGGHYVAYTRGIVAGKLRWFLCNDKVVTPISDLDMTRIALRGYGSHKGFLPTTFLYKRMEPANNPPPIDLPEANDAAFLVASVKDGVCQVIMENLEGKPAHVQELAQSLKTLLEERPAKEIEDTETGITKSKSRSCWNKPDFFIKVIGIAIIALIIHALCENNKKNQKKKGPHSPKNDSTETKNSKIADRLTTAYSGPVALGKLVLESLLKKGSE